MENAGNNYFEGKRWVTDLYGVMYKPFNFDSTRKYPVISYVYPGPQTESVQYSFTVSGGKNIALAPVSYTHLRAHETVLDLVCRLLLEKKKNKTKTIEY